MSARKPGGQRAALPGGRAEVKGVEGVGVQRFSDAEVVRHALVSRIVRAYSARGK